MTVAGVKEHISTLTMQWEVLESLLVQRLKNYSISELGTNIVMCASMQSPLDVNQKNISVSRTGTNPVKPWRLILY